MLKLNSSKKNLSFQLASPMKVCLLVSLTCLGILTIAIIDRWQVNHWRTIKEIELQNTANSLQRQLENTIEARFAVMEALAALFTLHPKTKSEEFAQFASYLMQINPPVRALQFADSETRVIYVYPAKNNEVTISNPMHLLSDPKRSSYVKKAINKKTATFQGPFELRQGGQGGVVRLPIFKDNEFFGLIIGVYDIDVLIKEAIEGKNSNQITFSLERDGKTFWGPDDINTSVGTQKKFVSINDDKWVLAVNWQNGVTNPPVIIRLLLWICASGFLLSSLLLLHRSWTQTQNLEKIVEQRTEELTKANKKLVYEVNERKRIEDNLRLDEGRLEALLKLSHMTSNTTKEIADFALNEAIGLTNSEIGYLAFTNEDESVLSMYSWSKKAMDLCSIQEKPIDYPVEGTGLWGEALRQRKEIITNDYQADNPLKKGYPEGHIHLSRHMNVPVFDGEHIVVVAGVGNKKEAYDESDLRQLNLLMQGMWRLIQQRNTQNDKNKLEERLRQAQKMEAIGALAGGIAHDFNNILFPLMGFSELLHEDLPKNSPEQKKISEVLQAALRAKELVKQILTFSRQEDKVIEPVKIQSILKEALKLMASSIPKTIEIRTDIDPDCGVVLADPTQMHQIIMNLATNAYHAMEKTGGLIKITLEQKEISSPPMGLSEFTPGNYALLKVIDTGTGINKEVINKIFDPYFTTKEKDKGTGLGLSVVQGIVKSCKGNIHVYSEPDKGTEVHIYLPIINKTTPMENIKSSGKAPGGTEKILLVDDEKAIVRMEQQMLERLGYQVTTKTGSFEALELFSKNPNAFDLMITDMTMPNMTGLQLARKIKTIKTDFPVIICTGFSDQINEKTSKEMGIQGFVVKPVIKIDIAQKIRNVLDQQKKDNT